MKIIKTKISDFELVYKRLDESVSFFCERCNADKKSKTIIQMIVGDGSEKIICNGCYGNILAKK